MIKKYLISILIILALIGTISYFSKAKNNKTIPEAVKTEDIQNSEFKAIDDFRINTIDPKYPYYEPDGITYKQNLSKWIDDLLIKNNLTEETEIYKTFLTRCKEYALTQGDEGFGAYHVGFSVCLIYKLDNF